MLVKIFMTIQVSIHVFLCIILRGRETNREQNLCFEREKRKTDRGRVREKENQTKKETKFETEKLT